LWLGALIGAGLRLHGGQRVWSVAVLAAAPFALPILQPYGGEIVLRVYLFALPGVAVLFASLILASGSHSARTAGYTVFAMTAVLMVGFLFARHGNDRVWLFSKQEAGVVDKVYDIAAPGSVLAAPTTTLPWQYRRYAELEHVSLERLPARVRYGLNGRPLARAVFSLLNRAGDGRGYVIVTRSLRAYDEMFGSASWGTVPQLESALDHSPRFKRIISKPDGRVWETVPEPAVAVAK
jgi:hypothetical protein